MKMRHTKIPTCLVPGDTIYVLAPSSPFNPDKFNQGLDILKSLGFNLHIPPGLFESRGYLAGDDDHRAKLFNDAFKSGEIKAVMCARGGFGSVRILDRIDYRSICHNPKIFIGFSDISSLLANIYQRCGLVTFHGPTVASLADADKKTVDAMFSAVTSEKVLCLHSPDAVSLRSGFAKGPVIGGNLTTLCHLAGTPFAPDYRDHILFLEDTGEAPYRIDRMLTQMKMAGYFDRVAGMILGNFTDCGTLEDVIKVFKDCLADFDFPILAGFQIGHEATNITLPIGIEATLNSDEKYLCYHAPCSVRNTTEKVCFKTADQRGLKDRTAISLPVRSSSFHEINNLMIEAVKKFIFPGSVLLFSKNGSILFHKAYGIRNIFSNSPVSLNTVFDLASLTKPLAVATSIMVLVRDGKLDLQERIWKILPEFKKSKMNKIGIEHLLSHSSGLTDYIPYFKILEKFPFHERKTRLRSLLVNAPLKNPVGCTTLYSDLGYMILSWIIERTANRKIDELLNDEVFRALGLENLFYHNFYNQKKIVAEYAATEICPWRKTLMEGIVHDENAFAVGGIEGHAGLFGTAENIHRLLMHFLTLNNDSYFRGLIPNDLVKIFFQRFKGFERTLGYDTPSNGNSSSGSLFSRESVGHLGFTGTSFWIDLNRSIIVILLTNRIHPDRKNENLKFFRPILHDAIMGKILKMPS